MEAPSGTAPRDPALVPRYLSNIPNETLLTTWHRDNANRHVTRATTTSYYFLDEQVDFLTSEVTGNVVCNAGDEGLSGSLHPPHVSLGQSPPVRACGKGATQPETPGVPGCPHRKSPA